MNFNKAVPPLPTKESVKITLPSKSLLRRKNSFSSNPKAYTPLQDTNTKSTSILKNQVKAPLVFPNVSGLDGDEDFLNTNEAVHNVLTNVFEYSHKPCTFNTTMYYKTSDRYTWYCVAGTKKYVTPCEIVDSVIQLIMDPAYRNMLCDIYIHLVPGTGFNVFFINEGVNNILEKLEHVKSYSEVLLIQYIRYKIY